jgi:hypothetical protein
VIAPAFLLLRRKLCANSPLKSRDNSDMAPSRHEVGKADLDIHWSRSTAGRFKPARKSPRGGEARANDSARIAESQVQRRRYALYAGDDDEEKSLSRRLSALARRV